VATECGIPQPHITTSPDVNHATALSPDSQPLDRHRGATAVQLSRPAFGGFQRPKGRCRELYTTGHLAGRSQSGGLIGPKPRCGRLLIVNPAGSHDALGFPPTTEGPGKFESGTSKLAMRSLMLAHIGPPACSGTSRPALSVDFATRHRRASWRGGRRAQRVPPWARAPLFRRCPGLGRLSSIGPQPARASRIRKLLN
jgi:hypothetical protein